MLFLEAEDPDKDIHLYINSPGGSVTAGMAIYDTMQYVKPAISTICMGQAASMGSLLLAAGEKAITALSGLKYLLYGAAPMPLPAPVTSAILRSKSPIIRLTAAPHVAPRASWQGPTAGCLRRA